MGNFDNTFMEYSPELENFEFEESEWTGEGEVFSEAELMELAGELLEVNSEAELDQFLSNAVTRAARKLKKAFARRSGECERLAAFLKASPRGRYPSYRYP